jgi:hypothetical protein
MTGPRFIDVSRPGIAGGGSALVNLSDVHTAVRTWDKEDGVGYRLYSKKGELLGTSWSASSSAFDLEREPATVVPNTTGIKAHVLWLSKEGVVFDEDWPVIAWRVHSNGPPEPVFVEEVGDDAVVLEMPSSGRCVWGDYTYDTLAEAKSAFRERRLEDRANADQTAPASTPSFADGGWAPPSPVEP